MDRSENQLFLEVYMHNTKHSESLRCKLKLVHSGPSVMRREGCVVFDTSCATLGDAACVENHALLCFHFIGCCCTCKTGLLILRPSNNGPSRFEADKRYERGDLQILQLETIPCQNLHTPLSYDYPIRSWHMTPC